MSLRGAVGLWCKNTLARFAVNRKTAFLKGDKVFKTIIVHIYTFFALLWIMMTYSKEQIQYMYDFGMIGIEEGRIMRKIFRK